MTTAQIIWAALIFSAAVVNCPFLFFLLSKRTAPMPVIADYQPVIDKLDALATDVAALKATSDAAAGAPSAQDLADTLAAVSTAADGVAAAAQPTVAP